MATVFDATQPLLFPAKCVNTGEDTDENIEVLGYHFDGFTAHITWLFIPMSPQTRRSYRLVRFLYALNITALILVIPPITNLALHLPFDNDLIKFLIAMIIGGGLAFLSDRGTKIIISTSLPAIYQDTQAAQVVDTFTKPSGASYSGLWLVVRDDEWAKLVQGRVMAVIPPREEDEEEEDVLPQPAIEGLSYLSSQTKTPPYPLTTMILTGLCLIAFPVLSLVYWVFWLNL